MLQPSFELAGKAIGPEASPYVIAEIGSNFDQSLDKARELIDVAAKAGADAVKFQLFRADTLYRPGDDLYEIFRSIELNPDWLETLADHAASQNVAFMASSFDPGSVDALEAVGVPAHKVASSETTNTPLLTHIAATGKPLFVSTGMCDLTDVVQAINVCRRAGNGAVALLQCGSLYPLEPAQANLKVMDTFQRLFSCPVGFSDHTLGGIAAIAAVGRGACILEKHITLDRGGDGPDHFYAMEPDEFGRLVASVREAYATLGNGEKELLAQEREIGRREGLYATRSLKAGDILSSDVVDCRRPATGIRARDIFSALGAKLGSDVAAGAPIHWQDLDT